MAFDWHQVTDNYRASRFKALRADWETGELLQSVLDVYHQTAHNCGQFDEVIILSHIEKSKKNLEFLLKSARVNRLPVDLVFLTGTRTGAGGKAAVLQALLGDRKAWPISLEHRRSFAVCRRVFGFIRVHHVHSWQVEWLRSFPSFSICGWAATAPPLLGVGLKPLVNLK